MKLNQSLVSFNHENHTYILDGRELSGITGLISGIVFPEMYKNVNEELLNAAAQKGAAVHKDLELGFIRGSHEYETLEAVNANRLLNEQGFEQLAAEYVVDNGDDLATAIDNVSTNAENEIVLIDYKTTASLNREYLQWQLSLGADFFERLNPELKVSKLYALHTRNSKCELVEVKRIDREFTDYLVDCWRNFVEFKNPLHETDGELESLMNEYQAIEMSRAEAADTLNYYKGIQDNIKARIQDLMDERGLNKHEGEGYKITRTKDRVTKKFDFDTFKENNADFVAEHEQLWKSGIKETTTKGYVTIKLQ